MSRSPIATLAAGVRRAKLRGTLALLLLLLATGPLLAQDVQLRIEIGGQATVHAGRAVDGAAAFPLDVLRQLGANLAEDPRGATVILLGDTLRFDVGTAIFQRGTLVHQLAYPVSRVDAAIMVPEQFFIEWLPRWRPQQVVFTAGVLRFTAAAPADAHSVAAQRVVILDAGHGGEDPGKVARNGLREKDFTLSLTQRLAGLLRSRGYEVHMTRTADVLVPLAERPRIANRLKAGRPASLFLSIHANSAESAAAAGYETYFLAEARTEDERRVAERENAVTRFEADAPATATDDVEFILTGLRNDFYQRASNDLAEVVQRQLAGFHPGRNRGVKQAGFLVLVGAFMPAVLVEVGFLSNPEEAVLLGTTQFQEKLAWALADAVDQYFAEHEHLLISDPG